MFPEDIKERILAPIGYPVITEDDLEVPFSFLYNNCIVPAMKQYFRYFPIKERTEISVAGSYEIKFPDKYTYSVTDARLHTAQYNNSTDYIRNPFLAERRVQTSSSSNSGSRYNASLDVPDLNHLNRAQRQTSINMNRQYTVNVDEHNRKVTGFVNIGGTLSIEWAKYSDKWDDVTFLQEENVIKLSIANVLDYFGSLRGQETSDIPVTFDADQFTSTAKDLREEVMEAWKQFTKVVAIRK